MLPDIGFWTVISHQFDLFTLNKIKVIFSNKFTQFFSYQRKLKFPSKDFFNKYKQIHTFLSITFLLTQIFKKLLKIFSLVFKTTFENLDLWCHTKSCKLKQILFIYIFLVKNQSHIDILTHSTTALSENR